MDRIVMDLSLLVVPDPNMPWFLKTLDETTTDNIELRVCSDQGLSDEDIPLDIIEIYVK